MFGWCKFKQKQEIEHDNVELARLVRVLFQAIEDGKLSKEEIRQLKEEAYNVVIKYNL